MRAFVATVFHETSAFSPVPTGLQAFEEVLPYRAEGAAITEASRSLPGYGTLVRAAEAAGCEVHASAFLFAQPSARCSVATWTTLRDRILDDLAAHGPFDLLLFFLHGAQMADGLDDCEGDLLARARTIAPDAVSGCLLDLHANVTEVMAASVDVLIACREYPHTDFDARAAQMFELCHDAALRGTRLHSHFARVLVLGRFYTSEGGMAALTAAAMAHEGQGDVLAASLIHGFPYANTPDAGAGVVLVTRGGSPGPAMHELRRGFFTIRGEALEGVTTLPEVVDRIAAAVPGDDGRLLVVADYADNAGGGAAGDSTFVLEALLARGVRDVALGLVWDPVAAGFARDAGAGSTLALRLGGKSGPTSGRPLDVRARVLAVRDDVVQDGLGLPLRLGLAAALDIDGVIVIVNAERQQLFGPECFTEFGIELASLRAVVVKSTQHFRAAFGPLAREILYADTPGDMTVHITADRFDGVARPVWPLDEIANL